VNRLQTAMKEVKLSFLQEINDEDNFKVNRNISSNKQNYILITNLTH